jgi:hypothetical protein
MVPGVRGTKVAILALLLRADVVTPDKVTFNRQGAAMDIRALDLLGFAMIPG